MKEEQQILFMQIRMIRLYSERFSISLKKTAELFKKFSVLSFIREGFGIFHIEGDEAVFEDVKNYIWSKNGKR